MKVEIWSDIVCPWCYIGKRRFERALEQLPQRDQVHVVWRSFELDPNAPRLRQEPPAERLAAKYGISLEDAKRANWQMTARAMQEGLEYNLDQAKSGNTFDAHRVIHLAAESGRQDGMKERLLKAYFQEAEAIGEPGVLQRLALEVGIDEVSVADVLNSDTYAAAVRADEAQASALGITGVPFFLVDGSVGIEGAQPAETFLEVLKNAAGEVRV